MAFSGMGAVPLAADRCGFRVWAPNAQTVQVAGSFNDWQPCADHSLQRDGDSGYWSGEISHPAFASITDPAADPPTYRYVFDEEHWRVDAYAYDIQRDSAGNANTLIVDRSTTWAPFATPARSDLILYQLHVGSFAGMNDGIPVAYDPALGWHATCRDIVAKLDYIRGLGFNALALLPIGEFPRPAHQRHMGYAPTHWFAPEDDFGHPHDVQFLVDEAHRRGLAVIVDVVYNHASVDVNPYWNYDGHDHDGGIYFEGGGDSDFGRIPAHWKHEVRQFFLDNARMWLDDYRADGIRFDAAHLIQWESLQFLTYHLRQNPYWRDKFLIAEWTGDDRDNWPNVIRDIGFDATWGMAGPYGFREAIKQGAFGGDPVSRLLSVMERHPYRDAWNIIRYYLGSHDQVRDNQSGTETDHRYMVEHFGGRADWTARAQCRMGWALSVTAPGVPMLFMGSEGHLPGYWYPTLDDNPLHRDHRFDWQRVGDAIGAPMQRLVRDANQLRWDHPALRGPHLDVCHQDHDNHICAFRRWTDSGDVVLTVVNCSGRSWPDWTYGIDTGCGGSWREVFNSQAPSYDGYADSGNGPQTLYCAGSHLTARIPSWSVLCFVQVGP